MSTQRLIGQVKWFNNKAGYGFITVSDGENAGKDIFAHFSTINVADSQYRYLVQGEYVEFELSKSTNETHEFQATGISGIKGGMLMCETRQTNRPAKKEKRERPTADSTTAPTSASTSASTSAVEDGFQTVQKRRTTAKKPVATAK
jgi:cold shock CspA family protein